MKPTDPTCAATVVIVPRERFSFSLRSLDSVLAQTEHPLRLIYVDGGSPPRVRDALAARAREHGFELLRIERFLSPNEARNIGLRAVRTPYVAFLDNDVLVAPGWLSALLARAERSGAAAVGPLYLQGWPDEGVVHMAGGSLHWERREEGLSYRAEHRYQGRRLDALDERLRAAPCDFIEFHCMLVRCADLHELGALDEALLNTREHIDLCLELARRGREVWFEPASRVAYVPGPPFTLTDIAYYLVRWSDEWSRASLEHFHAKWGLSWAPTRSNLAALRKRRYAFLGAPYAKLIDVATRTLGAERTKHLADRWVYPVEAALNRLALSGSRGARARAARRQPR